MPYRSQEAILAEWHALVARVEALATACAEDPEVAVKERLQPDVRAARSEERAYGGVQTAGPANMTAAWLRAAAKKLIPEEVWKYDVTEFIGGGAAVVLLHYKDADAFGPDNPIAG